ncbi:uncharacterized protein LOC134540860 isoform X3 [Bacillus rossius redtenbacheri]|uniref:uncharacterized protein LOC134540860 isoform X3 n=1 Tax=Bacillus rossius redtenbacheri TaxID=93214 RepID=UPI002FDDA1C8
MKRKSLRDAARRGDQQVGYGQTRHRSIDEMEVAQPLSEHAKAFDAVFFIGTSADGCYFVLGAERRKHGIVNGLCYLMTPNTGLLCSSKLPDTVLFEAQDDQFGAEGVSAAMLQPMRKWRAQFDGDMRSEARPGELHRVRIDVTFSSEWPHFNFDTDLHPAVLCRALAREPWSRRYFDNLKNAHQTHYEQMGFIDGTADIDGRVVQLQMQGFRDHSYGDKRDWELMHRYSFHMLFLESGLRATIGVICQPCTGSVLETGYVYSPDGDVQPLEWCDLKLYQHGEGGTPPVDYAFQFRAGGQVYTAQLMEESRAEHYKGWRWEARLVERFLTCRVNGVPGRAVSEFHYRSTDGRPQLPTDPPWFRQVAAT